MKKYKYVCLDIYSGDLIVLKSNNFYKKNRLLKGQYECKECVDVKTHYCYYY